MATTVISPANQRISQLLKCEKKVLEISPLQIIDYSKIRDKAVGRESFNYLKNSIRDKGFLPTISSIWGLELNPSDDFHGRIDPKYVLAAGFSDLEYRAINIDWTQKVIALIDGAQRIEAITQLIQEDEMNKTNIFDAATYKIQVIVPSDNQVEYSFSEVVAAAHVLNNISRECVEVSFWDKLSGYASIKNAINLEPEYKDVLQYGFASDQPRCMFFINAMNGNSNFFDGLKLIERSNLAKSLAAPSGKYQDSHYVLNDNNVYKGLLRSYNMTDYNLAHYSKEMSLLYERVVSNEDLYGVLKGINAGVYPILTNALLSITGVSSQEAKMVTMQHAIFEKAIYEVLAKLKQLRRDEELDIFLARVIYHAVEYDSMDKQASKKVNFKKNQMWYTNQFEHFELGMQQYRDVLKACDKQDLMELPSMLRGIMVEVLVTSTYQAQMQKVFF